MKKELYERTVWENTKEILVAPCIVGLVFASLFFVCFLVSEYPSYKNAVGFGVSVFLLLFGYMGVRPFWKGYWMLKVEEKYLGVLYKNRNDFLKRPDERDWFVGKNGPWIVYLHRDFIDSIVHVEEIDRGGKKKSVMAIQVVFLDKRGKQWSFLLDAKKTELRKFLLWYEK